MPSIPLSNAELLALVYRHLVRDTLLPSDPLLVGRAALKVIEGPAAEPPTWFGADMERDARWLADRLGGQVRPWPAAFAMVTAADKPHTGLGHVSSIANIGAVQTGAPRTSPGVGLWRHAGGGLVVARVDEGGSAQASGLRPGDLVMTIDGVAPRPSGLHAIALYGAPEGTKLVLQIERAGEILSIDLVFRAGAVVSLASRLLPDRVGYVGIPWFASSDDPTRDTGALVRAALTGFDSVGAVGVIFDLRAGMGGSGRAVRDILSALCSAEIVLAVADPGGEPEVYPRTADRVWPDRPIAVLVNEQTTSAAEALSIGLEELAGAALVGATTSGGLNTLRTVELKDGYMLILPDQVFLGPQSLATRPGYRLQPTVAVPNPTASEVAAGVDAQLEVARAWVVQRAGHGAENRR